MIELGKGVEDQMEPKIQQQTAFWPFVEGIYRNNRSEICRPLARLYELFFSRNTRFLTHSYLNTPLSFSKE